MTDIINTHICNPDVFPEILENGFISAGARVITNNQLTKGELRLIRHWVHMIMSPVSGEGAGKFDPLNPPSASAYSVTANIQCFDREVVLSNIFPTSCVGGEVTFASWTCEQLKLP